MANCPPDQRQKIKVAKTMYGKVCFVLFHFSFRTQQEQWPVGPEFCQVGYYIFTSTDKYGQRQPDSRDPRRDVFNIYFLKFFPAPRVVLDLIIGIHVLCLVGDTCSVESTL